METHGPLGTLWVGLGLGAFYIALIWINSLLGIFTGPLFMVPLTWVMDRVQKRPIGAGGLIRAEPARDPRDPRYVPPGGAHAGTHAGTHAGVPADVRVVPARTDRPA